MRYSTSPFGCTPAILFEKVRVAKYKGVLKRFR